MRDPANPGAPEPSECPGRSRRPFCVKWSPTLHHISTWKGSVCFPATIVTHLAVDSGESLPTQSSYWLEGGEEKQGTCVSCKVGQVCANGHLFILLRMLLGLGEVQPLAQHHVISEWHKENLKVSWPHIKACALPFIGLAGEGGGEYMAHSTQWTPLPAQHKLICTCPGWADNVTFSQLSRDCCELL